jgi:hypothetical protein
MLGGGWRTGGNGRTTFGAGISDEMQCGDGRVGLHRVWPSRAVGTALGVRAVSHAPCCDTGSSCRREQNPIPDPGEDAHPTRACDITGVGSRG